MQIFYIVVTEIFICYEKKNNSKIIWKNYINIENEKEIASLCLKKKLTVNFIY